MVPYNQNWERWCKIAFIKHFDDGKGDTYFFAEGFPRATEDKSDYVELRLDGPYSREDAHKQWRLYYELNLLVVVRPDAKGDAYRINRLTGRFSELFTDNILVHKEGDTVDDDGTLLGYLRLVPRLQERIQVSHFGQIRPDTHILQATVEGHYAIYLD